MKRDLLARLLMLPATLLVVTASALAQTPERRNDVVFPENATALEGLPQVRIDTTRDDVSRRELDATESGKSRLTIKVVDGRLYWGDQPGNPLTVATSGDFTYLSSTEPGRYVRLQRVNDRLTYAEHVDFGNRSVTYWGELRIVLGK
jgi:hypothetical protein